MKILIAIDDINVARGIIPLLKDCASAAEAEIKVATVIPSIMAYSSLAVVPNLAQELRDDSRRDATTLTLEFATELRAAFRRASVDEIVIEGTPAHEILALAGEWEPDLIVVGSHGYKGIRKMILGSVSQAIVAQAHCNVLISRKVGPGKAPADKMNDFGKTAVGRQAATKAGTPG